VYRFCPLQAPHSVPSSEFFEFFIGQTLFVLSFLKHFCHPLTSMLIQAPLIVEFDASVDVLLIAPKSGTNVGSAGLVNTNFVSDCAYLRDKLRHIQKQIYRLDAHRHVLLRTTAKSDNHRVEHNNTALIVLDGEAAPIPS